LTSLEIAIGPTKQTRNTKIEKKEEMDSFKLS